MNRPSGKKRKAIAARRALKRMDRQEAKFARTLERMTPYGIPPSFSAYDITGKDWDNLACGVCGASSRDCRCEP